MSAQSSPHKLAREDPGAAHRLRMCALAIGEAPALSVCELELDRPAPSYTVDTLRAIHASHPDAELTFILGADTACTLASWREPAAILELARLAVAARSGSPRGRVREVVASLLDANTRRAQQRISFLEMPALEVSSSAVRARVARGQPVAELVGVAVAGYIASHGLYRAASGVVS